MVTTSDFNLYSSTDYFRQLIDDIKQTGNGDRLALLTMTFEPREPLIAELMQALNDSARRGADVSLGIDAFSFLLKSKIMPGPLLFSKNPSKFWEPFRGRLAALQKLNENGGRYTILNQPSRPFLLPHAGRSHIKATVINDKLYVGGCNLMATDQIDVMVGWHDKKTADWLYKKLQHIIETGQTRKAFAEAAVKFDIDNDTCLLIDAGVPGQSQIYDQALALIDNAREWLVLTCQFFPGGRTAQHLLNAQRRGVDIRIIYGHPGHHGIEALAHHAYNARERIRLPANFFSHQLAKKMPLLHAKILASEQGAMIGSHNYVAQGVRLGTAEIALQRYDPQFSQKLTENVLQQLS